MCLNVVTVCGIGTVVFNANPLLRYDGYYILADYLEIPNLRAKADGVCTPLSSGCSAGEMSHSILGHRNTGKRGTASSRRLAWFIAGRWPLRSWLSCTASRSPLGWKRQRCRFWRVATGVVPVRFAIEAHRTSAGRGARNSVRLAIRRAVGIAFVRLVYVPVPWPAEASFELEPRGVKRVYVTVAGRLALVAVRPGQNVRRGEVLVRLENPALEGRLEQLETTRELFDAEVKIEALRNDPARAAVAGNRCSQRPKRLPTSRDKSRNSRSELPVMEKSLTASRPQAHVVRVAHRRPLGGNSPGAKESRLRHWASAITCWTSRQVVAMSPFWPSINPTGTDLCR